MYRNRQSIITMACLVFTVAATQSASVNAQLFSGNAFTADGGFYGAMQHVEGKQIGDIDPFSAFSGTQFVPVGNGTLSLFGQIGGTNRGAWTGTAGVNRRIWLNDRTIIGGGLWYDINESRQENIFQQGAVSLELLRDEWSVRANGYLPIGPRVRNIFTDVQFSPLAFQGNHLATQSTTTLFDEVALKGFDVEIARTIGNLSSEAYVGYYNFQGRLGGQTNGIKGGVRGYLTPSLAANVTVSNDPMFGTNVFGGLTWFFGGSGGTAPGSLEDKLTIPVIRNQQVVVKDLHRVLNNVVILTDQGNPLTVTHVDDGAAGSNLGTFENPFNTNSLPGSQTTDIVYVYAGDTYTNGYTLAANQRLLGEGNGLVHTLNTDQLGMIALPVGNGGPTRSIVQGTLLAANDSEISNFTSQPATTAIQLSGLTGNVNVNNVSITGGTTGVDVIGGSGAFTFTELEITNPSVTAFKVSGGSATVDVSLGAGGIVNAAGNSVAIQNMTGGGVTFQNGAGGPIDDTGTGILIAGNSGGTVIDFNNSVTLATTTNDALTMTNNAGATINFDGGLDIDTTSGTGLTATGGGTINITGASNSILTVETAGGATDAGSAIVMNGVTIGTNNITFASISASHLAGVNSGLSFDSLNAGGSFNGGDVTVSDLGGAAVRIANTPVDFTFGTTAITLRGAEGIDLDGTGGTIVFGATTISGTGGGTAGIDISGSTAGGVLFSSVTVDDGAAQGILLTNNTGNFGVTGTTNINDPLGIGIEINGGSGNVTFATTNINSRGTTGIEIDGTSGVNLFGTTTIANANNAGGNAIDILNSTGGSTTFAFVDIDDSLNDGVNVSGNLGTTTISDGEITRFLGSGVLVLNSALTTVNSVLFESSPSIAVNLTSSTVAGLGNTTTAVATDCFTAGVIIGSIQINGVACP